MPRHRNLDRHDQPRLALVALDDAFAAAPAPAPRAIPDSRYQVQVEDVELTTVPRSGQLLLKWRLRVRAPACAGALLWKNHPVSSQNLAWLKHDLRLCGLELDRLSDLPDHLAALLAVELEVTKRTNGVWENVYFNHRLEPPPPSDDDVPF